jgi:hypothetical protein
MNVAIYRMLDLEARRWLKHPRSRDLQRRSIRATLEIVRAVRGTPGGHVVIAGGGATVSYTRPGYGECRLHGYGLATCAAALAAMASGVPWVDLRRVDVGVLLRAPLIAVGREPDPAPWGPIDHAPLAHVFRLYRDHGGIVGNIALD